MPYEIREKSGKYEVCKVGSNDCYGTHDTMKEAQAQIVAIEANEEKSTDKMMMVEVGYSKFPQSVVNYTAMTSEPGEMCGGCWFYQSERQCRIVDSYPLPIVATGYCEKFTDGAQVIAQMPEMKGKSDNKDLKLSTLQRVKNAIIPPQEVTEYGVFKALGDGKWMAAYSNDFEDREKEIIERAGHDRFIKRLKSGLVPMPELWVWHTKGTRIGEAIDIDRYGHIVVAIGTFDANPIAKEAEKNLVKAGTKDLRLSHGFKYPLWAYNKESRTYSDLNTFEITLLPEGAEANPYTAFDVVVKENTMPVSEEKRGFFQRIFGDKAPDVIGHIEGMENRSKEVEAMGTRYKDVTDVTPPPTEQTATDTPQTDEDQKLFSDMILDFVSDVNNMYGLLKSIDQSRQKDQAEIAELRKELKAATDALNTQTKALQAEQQLAPRSVQQPDNAGTSVTNSKEAEEAHKELDGQTKGDESVDARIKKFVAL